MREYLFAALIASAVTYLATPFFKWLAIRRGAMAPIRARDVHLVPTPRWGGLAMLAGLSVGLVVAYHLPLLHKAFENSHDPIAIASGALVIVLLGAADDLWELDALTKFAGQALAAGVMAIQGVQLLWLPINGVIALPPTLGVVATVLVVLVAINAVNFVDGLDGLAAGIVAIGGIAFFSFSYLLAVIHGFSRAGTATLFTALLVGICLGFLPHNVYPAKIFMGDSGSMLLGYLLAACTISITGQLDANALSAENLAPALLPLVLPLAILAIPLLDLGWAVIRRTAAGKSPFTPDKHHLHHRLLRIGHSPRRATSVLYVWTAAIAFPVTAIAFIPMRSALFIMVVALVLAALLTRSLPAEDDNEKRRMKRNNFEGATLRWAGSLSGGAVLLAVLYAEVVQRSDQVKAALLAGGVVAVFFGISLLLGRLTRKSSPSGTMAWAMASYFAKLILLGALLLGMRSLPGIDHAYFGVTAVTAVILWLVGEVTAFLRMRIPTLVVEEENSPIVQSEGGGAHVI